MNERLQYLRDDIADWGLRHAPPHAIALFRIALGTSLFISWLLLLLDTQTISNVEWLFLLAVLLNLALITIGAWMRVAALIVAGVYGYQWFLFANAGSAATEVTSEGAAIFFCLTFLILALSRADCAFSVEMHKRYGTPWEWEDVPLLPQRLLALLISGIYVVIGYHKLWQPVFHTGVTLQRTLIGPWGTALAARLARALPVEAFHWTIYALKAFGLMLPVCVWLKAVRTWFMIGGTIIHIAMALFLNVSWTLILIPGYLLFLDPEEVQELWERFISRKTQ